MKERTFEQVYKDWNGKYCKRVNYKGRELKIIIIQEVRFDRAFYVGYASMYPRYNYYKDSKSFESIHYDKVVSRFQRFVDEYCTEWQARADVPYKGYTIKIDQEKDKEFYIGTVQFHKNSTYKHIADTREEVERCCKNRIGKVVYEKEKVTKLFKQEFYDKYKGYELKITYEPTMSYPYLGKEPYVGRVRELLLSWRGKTPEDIKKEFREYFDKKGMGRKVEEEVQQTNMLTPKQEKIQELEQLQARISVQLEELKKEKDILTYKGVVLEYGIEEGLPEGYMIGRIRNAPEGTKEFKRKVLNNMKVDFEEYIDALEKAHYIFNMIRPEIKNRY